MWGFEDEVSSLSLLVCDETTSQNLEVVLVTTPGFWGLVLFMSGIAQAEERDNNP